MSTHARALFPETHCIIIALNLFQDLMFLSCHSEFISESHLMSPESRIKFGMTLFSCHPEFTRLPAGRSQDPGVFGKDPEMNSG